MKRACASPYHAIHNEISYAQLSTCLLLTTLAMQFDRWAVVVILALGILMVPWAYRRNGPIRVLRSFARLGERLHGFCGEPVTVHPLPAPGELRDALATEGYPMLELDGTEIATWSELATALEQHFGTCRAATTPRERVRASMQRAVTDDPRRRAIVWRDAHVSDRGTPGMVAALCAEWAAYAMTQPPSLLVFVDAPAPVPAEHDDTSPTQARNDRLALADAPDGAWWKPRPGELTR